MDSTIGEAPNHRRRHRAATARIASLVAIVGLVLPIAGGAATAAGTQRERYHISDAFSYDDCGLQIDATYEASGLYLLKNDGREMDNYSWRLVETNSANGKWFERSGNAMSADITAVHVEGTIYRFRTIEAGRSITFRDMNGTRLFSDHGMYAITYLLDTKGDADPSNDEVVDGSLELTADRGHHEAGAYFADHDWCEFVTGLIG